MVKEKPSIPKGTRDFLPEEIVKRNYIFDTIRQVYQLYGYKPIETPAMENLSTLLGKYGEEGDRLIFRILNSGDFLSKADKADLNDGNSTKVAAQICEKALRYDLTVPFARFVVQNQNKIDFPFKRYQIQPVWRADRPQKGRYREFFQCDADVIGSDSIYNEFELIQIIDKVFDKLGIGITIKINNRKILAGIAEYIGFADKIIDITIAIDKLDKIGLDKVNQELQERGLTPEAVKALQPVLLLKGNEKEKLESLESTLANSSTGLKGIQEMEEFFSWLDNSPVNFKTELDLTLARGLNYYTGAIIEVKANDVSIGSICGGGRYDDLTGIFGLPGVSGVGISFGADRIYDVMQELDLFPDELLAFSKVMIVNFGIDEQKFAQQLLTKLRGSDIGCEMYPEPVKMKKQMQYADKNNIPYVVLIGKDEMKTGKPALKNMKTGEQKNMGIEEIVSYLINK
ncbi:MAG: histidine--tRNA ligase [Bacteroidetes bacterium]|nr:MAG: histidine--tRNA ligase [Bacteroidota bacterium]